MPEGKKKQSMEIVYHLGAHCTDEERLVRCLLRNRDTLAAEGVAVPGPTRYRNILRDTASSLDGRAASFDTQEMLLEQILDDDAGDVRRLVLSWDSFLAFPRWVVRGKLYPGAADRVRGLAQTFADHDCEFFLALRNPATFIPELLSKQRDEDYEEQILKTDPLDLRWSDVVAEMVDKMPGLKLTVWCDEDTPLIWPEVLSALTGRAGGAQLAGADDFLATLISDEGLARYRKETGTQADMPVAVRRELVAELLETHARTGVVDQTIDMPDWDQPLIDALTEEYDYDVARIAGMQGVTFIAP